MQPYVFPYLGYFQLINASDKFVFLDDVNFIKNGWINRNRILLNGQGFLFSIPLKDGSSFKKISETEISENRFNVWRIKFLKTLEQAYKKAPCFEDVHELVLSIFKQSFETINQLAKESIIQLSNYLDIKTTFEKSSTIYDNKDLKGEARIIDICLKEKATHYFNAIGGLNLYNKEKFSKNKIELFFIKATSQSYPQFSNDFINNLSIIDVLMFNEPNHIKTLLSQYELI